MDMRRIRVQVQNGYDVCIGRGLTAGFGGLLRSAVGECRVAVMTDSNVAPLYLDALTQSLESSSYDVCAFVFPAGESSKRMDGLRKFLNF